MSDNKENRVFDFGSNDNTEVKEDPVITYKIKVTDNHELSPEAPMMTLSVKGSKGFMPNGTVGMFLSPSVRTAFSGELDGEAYNADITELDGRFEDFVRYLGENHIPVKLRISEAGAKGMYAVYGINATNLRGELRPESNAFLQHVIGRLLKSSYDDYEETATDTADKNDNFLLADMNSMSDYMACASRLLPQTIRTWAERNMQLVKTGNISPEEKMHARRALSIMLGIEWQSDYFESIDPVRAREILDEELFGMEKIKQRIIEVIIQINRTHTLPAYGILLAGPAGVGKSQLAYAIAKILKLPWTGLDMSSIRDAEALTGSPRVYANAKPGLIMEGFMKSGTSNLVFIINELDKADSTKNNSNPADALLTLLDNLGYTDNYIECMIPTGGVYTIATANVKSAIGAPLLSRFAVIDIPDYSDEEKKEIFRRFSLPKTLKRMGMSEKECIIDDDALNTIIEHYRGTTGCRGLEQAAEHLAANALYKIETQGLTCVKFTGASAKEVLTQ